MTHPDTRDLVTGSDPVLQEGAQVGSVPPPHSPLRSVSTLWLHWPSSRHSSDRVGPFLDVCLPGALCARDTGLLTPPGCAVHPPTTAPLSSPTPCPCRVTPARPAHTGGAAKRHFLQGALPL